MSDIYGGNAMQLTFFLLADLLAGRPVLPTASAQSLWLGAIVTVCFIYGLLGRREQKVLGLGLAGGASDLHRGCPATRLRARMMLPPSARIYSHKIG